ncbi:glyoxal oxidase N-terminus-domain-containing protein [Endogone sp. FLAS-F59071]|nr:glyoxal oxidase N-terminus-domain-containing protein [Endogone sp. FLAS-F59071]|eukprot:RUS19497.1 glyoxal oxidase N-terminus-domain-containing protein [Endogone sp. FLAS-F59071]
MKTTLAISLFATAFCLGTALTDPAKRQDGIFDDDGDAILSTGYARTGKMEQNGRTGVSAMHAILLNERKILIFDRSEESEAHFDSGQAAWSTEYDIELNQYRALHMQTNSFCSAGGFLANGTFVGTGGGQRTGRTYKAFEGYKTVRLFEPCIDGSCVWAEYPSGQMGDNRWYPTVEQLPDAGAPVLCNTTTSPLTRQPTSELFWPSKGAPVYMPFLVDTLEHNLYPFVHLLPSGNLWIFANRHSIIFNYNNNSIVRELPPIPGNPRNYPLTGTSVLLPLRPQNRYHVEVLVCGGSEGTRGGKHGQADNTCGRLDLDSENPVWVMDTFVFPRLMPGELDEPKITNSVALFLFRPTDSILLPDGTILFINGCQKGIAGFNRGDRPILEPIIYDPRKPHGERWTKGLAKSDIPRMYHSVALLIPVWCNQRVCTSFNCVYNFNFSFPLNVQDGRVWIAGSNPNQPANFTAVPFPTEFRVEYFSPPYLFNPDDTPASRPLISSVPPVLHYNQSFTVNVNLVAITAGLGFQSPLALEPNVVIVLINPGFATHSLHMSQRLVELESSLSEDGSEMTVKSPPNTNIFPPGPAWLYIVNRGVPGIGVKVMLAAS